MERYNRAWRDPGSPLTPLTPLSTQVFKFEASDGLTPTGYDTTDRSTNRSLKNSRLTVPQGQHSNHSSGGPTRFSESFLRTRSVFSPNIQSTTNAKQPGGSTRSFSTSRRGNSSISSDTTLKVKREPSFSDSTYSRFKHGSPVEHPTLSPRVRSLLNRTGNEHLTEMFTRQEIDIEVLIQMTLEDLEALGVRGARELKIAMEVIKFAKKFFR